MSVSLVFEKRKTFLCSAINLEIIYNIVGGRHPRMLIGPPNTLCYNLRFAQIIRLFLFLKKRNYNTAH